MKKKVLTTALFAAIAILFLLTIPSFLDHEITSTKPSALNRIQETGIIRCGYWIYEPFISKDPNTGEMSGITVDYLEATAARMGKVVIWEKEVGFDQIRPALDYGKFDVFCVPCSPNDNFLKQFDFVGSFGKLPYYLYTAKGKNITKEEMKTARFSVIDGYITSEKTKELFPEATISSLPQISAVADVYNHLKYNKADVILNEHVSALSYMRNNPNSIRRYEDNPLFEMTMYFPISKGDKELGSFMHKMTDTTLPGNKEIFMHLLKKYNLNTSALSPDPS